jgi:hypothetical protein
MAEEQDTSSSSDEEGKKEKPVHHVRFRPTVVEKRYTIDQYYEELPPPSYPPPL